MRFYAAFVPSLGTWITCCDNTVIKDGLDQDEAERFVALLQGDETAPTLPVKPVKKPAEKSYYDFETPYKKYPRKLGKATGMKWLKKHVKSDDKFMQFVAAVNFYAKYVSDRNVEEKYVMHFSTFARRFEDWTPDKFEETVKKPQFDYDEMSSRINV